MTKKKKYSKCSKNESPHNKTNKMTVPHTADAQADLSLRLAHSHFVGFVMRRLKSEHNVFCFDKMLINAVAAQEHMS